MKWNIRIINAASKSMRVLIMLKRSSPLLKPKNKLKFIKSMIIFVMIYGSPCCYTNVENLKVLEKVQKKCVEWISNSYYVNESYKNLLLATDILTIFIYLQLPHLLLLDKCINVAYVFDGSNYKILKDPARDLRSEKNIVFEHKNQNHPNASRTF